MSLYDRILAESDVTRAAERVASAEWGSTERGDAMGKLFDALAAEVKTAATKDDTADSLLTRILDAQTHHEAKSYMLNAPQRGSKSFVFFPHLVKEAKKAITSAKRKVEVPAARNRSKALADKIAAIKASGNQHLINLVHALDLRLSELKHLPPVPSKDGPRGWITPKKYQHEQHAKTVRHLKGLIKDLEDRIMLSVIR